MTNPFGPNRIEYESRPILWFSRVSDAISKAEKPIFIAGTRGSGKTSILRSLSTMHILEDPGLASQIGPLSWYGVFFQLNETFSPLIDNAASALISEPVRLDPAALAHRQFVIFSHYLELKIIDRLFETFSSLRIAGHLTYSASEERTVALQLHEQAFHFLPLPEVTTFFGLEELRRLLVKHIDRFFSSLFLAQPEKSQFFATDPGTLLNRVLDLSKSLIVGPSFAMGPIQIKILIDDCEALTSVQQQFLNSIIRKTRGTIKWCIAYIGGLYDTIRTIIPGQSLSNADRDVQNLDNRESDFRELCENVTSLRLYYAVPPQLRKELKNNTPLKAFSLRNRLGRISLNQLIDREVRSGHSEGKTKLLRTAEQAWGFLDTRVSKADRERFPHNQKTPPYVEGLALELMQLDHAAKPGGLPQSAALRRVIARKQGWAFLEACRTLRLHEYPYVGHQIILQISDLCIRDFLDIMGEIYEEAVLRRGFSAERLLDFINSDRMIEVELQRKAVSLASRKKLDGLESMSQPYEEESVRMVHALGKLTNLLQTEGVDPHRATTTERGLFRIDVGEMRTLAEKFGVSSATIEEVLKRAEKDGFIRDVSDAPEIDFRRHDGKTNEIVVRLHRRFAPHFRFSYRGPYSSDVLPAGRVLQLLLMEHRLDPDAWAESVFKDMTAARDPDEGKQSSFFDGDDR